MDNQNQPNNTQSSNNESLPTDQQFNNQPTFQPSVIQPQQNEQLTTPLQQPTYNQPPQRQDQSNHLYIKQEIKYSSRSFPVTDGQQLVCFAKVRVLSLKKHIDIYQDETAKQIIFTIQQEKIMAISKTYDVILSNGQKIGAFQLKVMQSMTKEHWDILDSNNNPIGYIEQDVVTAMENKAGNIIANDINNMLENNLAGSPIDTTTRIEIPQKFIAYMNNQPVCIYSEKFTINTLFNMDIDFSSDTGQIFNTTMRLAAAILLASEHKNIN